MRTSTRCYLLAIATTLLSLGAYARVLTPAEALQQVALQQSSGKSRVASIVSENSELALTVAAPGTTDAAVYVFNKPDNSGFVVIAADSDVPNLLLGFSDGDVFCNTHHSIHWWLSEYAAEIGVMRVNNARRGSCVPQKKIETTPTAERHAIDHIVKTIWAQGAPYNDRCPYSKASPSVRCPSGCVATAIAQVMNVHKWPPVGTGQHSYYSSAAGSALTFDYASTTFHWDRMMNYYVHESSENPAIQAQREAVSTLIYAVGVGVNMNYSATGSGSNYYEGATALLNYFNYDKGMQLLERNYFPLDEWTGMIYDELAAGRPVLYGGQNTQNGHAFVIDGYDTRGYFHVNWGWAGLSDGYYLITALDPAVQGTGGSDSGLGYDSGQNMIIGVQPPVEGSELKPSVKFINGFKVGQNEYSRLESGDVTFADNRGIFNNSLGAVKLTLGVKLVADDGTTTYIRGTEPISLSRDQGFRNYYVSMDSFPQSGSYDVYPVFVDENEQWHDALVPVSGVNGVHLTASPYMLKFDGQLQSHVEAVDFELNTDIVIGYNFSLTATLKATDGEYFGRVVPILEKDGREITTGTSLMVDVPENESVDYEWISKFGASLTPGDYQIYLIDTYSNSISDTLNVVISEAPIGVPEAEATISIVDAQGGSGTVDNPYIIDFANFRATINIDGESGYFAQSVSAYIFSSDNNALAAALPGDFLGLRAGARQTIYVTGDLSSMTKTRTYMATPWASSQGKLGSPVYFRDESTALDDVEATATVTVTPNPVIDCVNIASATPMSEVALITTGGSELQRVVCDGENETTLCMGSCQPGIYLVEVTMADGSVTVCKVIKQ